MKNVFSFVLFLAMATGYSQQLTIVNQDFEKALQLAKAGNKLLFIDFYTSWCIPCKELDAWVFKNDTASQQLSTNVVLLKYDAEKDTIFHLSKKYHVNSYPTALVLNKDGLVVNRQYGFGGETRKELRQEVYNFTNESVSLNKENKFIKGYSKNIDVSAYPQFYIDYVNRVDLKVENRDDFKTYWKKPTNMFSETYFSTVMYFAMEVPDKTADSFLANKKAYEDLYGSQDVEIALTMFTYGKFSKANKSKSQADFDNAVVFLSAAKNEETVKEMLPQFKKRFEKAQLK